MKKASAFTSTTHDMAILLAEQLSDNQGYTPEGYLICQNVPVSRIGVQYYYGYELGLQDQADKMIPVYRLPEDVFDPESLKSLESKPVTDDHPQQAVTVQNAGYLSMGHGRNARHNKNNVLADLVITNSQLIQGIREKRKYEISLGYTCVYEPYKDGFKQKDIRINHIAVVESGRAGSKVAIKDNKPLFIKRGVKTRMNKNEALAVMFSAFAKDASPEEIQAVLPFLTDAAPVKEEKSDSKDAGIIAGLLSAMTKDKKKETQVLTADDVANLVKAGVAKALEGKKLVKDSEEHPDEKEDIKLIKSMLGDEDPDKEEVKDEDPDEEDLMTDEDADEEVKDTELEEVLSKDKALGLAIKALRPLYNKLPRKEQKLVVDKLAQFRQKPSANTYAGILKAIQASKAVRDSESEKAIAYTDPSAISRKVMADRNPHYKK